jgi:hypothetical protein
MEMWLRLQDLKVFFEAATENMEAVVFTGKMKEYARIQGTGDRSQEAPRRGAG